MDIIIINGGVVYLYKIDFQLIIKIFFEKNQTTPS